jgi:hypothetical protein
MTTMLHCGARIVQVHDRNIDAFDRLLYQGLCAPSGPHARQCLALVYHGVLTDERAECYHVRSFLSAVAAL